jgi:hypothetical protein
VLAAPRDALRRYEDRHARDKPGHDDRANDAALRPGHGSAFPRRVLRPDLSKQQSLERKQRAQGMPDAQCTRSLACEWKKHTSMVTTGTPKQSGTPCANGFNGFLRDLPGDQALLPPSYARRHLTYLTPALVCQDHTTSPSARAAFVSCAIASIAFRFQRS